MLGSSAPSLCRARSSRGRPTPRAELWRCRLGGAAAPPAAAPGKEADDEVELEAGTAPRPEGSRRHLASW